MRKCTNIPYMRRALIVYDFETAPFWISLYMRTFFFISVGYLASVSASKSAKSLRKKLFDGHCLMYSDRPTKSRGTAPLTS
jgi:hypothetical protein